MKRVPTFFAALVLAAGPALAQDSGSDFREGADLLSEGAQLILRGILSELEPVEDGWQYLLDMLNDLSAYDAPEMLPNGDIIIRRRVPLEPGGEIDL